MAGLHRVAAVLVRSDRVLLCHRHSNRSWCPNVWDVPGGHIEHDESPVEAVCREVREELGVAIRLESEAPFRVYHPSPDLTVHAWVVSDWSGEILNLAPDEHDQIAWFERDELMGLRLADAALFGLLGDALELHR